MTVETARQEVLEALRHYVESYEASILQFARWMRLPLTDANGLGEVMWAESVGSPTSPTALAARLGITTGAVNALINRLEAKDLLARSRESEDRRAVTLRATSRAQELATPFLSASSRHLFKALDDYEPEQLVMVRDFIERFATILPRSVEGLGRDR